MERNERAHRGSAFTPLSDRLRGSVWRGL